MPQPLPDRLNALAGAWLACLLVPAHAHAADSGPAGPGLAAWFGLVVLSLLVVLAAALLWVARQRLGTSETGAGIAILGMRTLGPREQLVVVRIEDRILVLGHTSTQINLVTELEHYTAESASPPRVGAGFSQQLQRWLRREQP